MVEIVIGGLMVLFVVIVTLEAVRNRRNPLPLMSNDDKRFIEIENVKTRKMYECIKR